jgi:hypothetical protein
MNNLALERRREHIMGIHAVRQRRSFRIGSAT